MCGRFTLHSRLNLLLQQFAIEAGPELAPRYNIAPTQQVPVIRADRDSHQRLLELRRWGLIPSWAKDPRMGNRMINARGETVATKPSFRAAFKRRRCLVPANGYYEWQATSDGKQPYYIHLPDEEPFAMAGLYESWHPSDQAGFETFTVITTSANPDTVGIHDRMPVVLTAEDYDLWLDPDFEGREPLEALIKPFAADTLQLTPVSRRVNNPRHDDPDCLAPAGGS